MRSDFSQGFRAGVDHSRDALIQFLEDHSEDKDLLSIKEIIAEIKRWKQVDEKVGLTNIATGERWGLPLPLGEIEQRLDLLNLELSTLAKVIDEIEQKAKDLVKWQD